MTNTQTYEPEFLPRWQKASNYIGEDLTDYYVVYSYTPNQSGLINKANWMEFLDELDEYIKDEKCKARVGRYTCWTSDYRQILIHKKEYDALEVADRLREELSVNTILNDDLYYEMVYKQEIENIEWLAECNTEQAEKIWGYLQNHEPEAFDYLDGWVNEEAVERAKQKVYK